MKYEDPKNLILKRATFRVIDEKNLKTLLEDGKSKLRVKFGIDPTGKKIHIGRASTIQRLRDFQELGHVVVLIIGDFTALIGDSSDKEDRRELVTETQIHANLEHYKEQIGKILDLDKVEFRYNSEWLSLLNFKDILNLSSNFTVSQMIERENFSERYKNNKPIGLHEFLYPLMQGYDSVAIKADVELGGSDQLFNLLSGREIQGIFKMKKQNIVTKKLLSGTDGRKMSTSWGNVINITDKPEDIYGKVMSIKDDSIIEYFTITTRFTDKLIKEMEEDVENSLGSSAMMDIKKILAKEITKMYSSYEDAIKAENNFKKLVQNKDFKSLDDIIVVDIKESNINILDLISSYTGQVPSKAEARRLISSGGVYINDTRINEINTLIEIKNDMIIKIGKRNIIKINHE